jgi:hypothetical protein
MVVAALILLLGAPAGAQEWEFDVTAYLWATGIDGDVGVRGSPTISVSADFADIFENLDFAALLFFEARKGPWVILLDADYVKISADGDTPGPLFSRVDVGAKLAVITPALGYRVWDNPAGGLDVYAGARIWVVETELKLTSSGVVQTQRFGGTKAWADPVVGARLRAPLVGKLFAAVIGDVGGFGVASDFTWQAYAGLGYQLTDRWSLKVGYRALGVDYESDGFRLDIIEHGPLIGVGFRF